MFDFYICSKESNYLKLTKLNILIISIIVISILAYTTLASRNISKINKKLICVLILELSVPSWITNLSQR